LLQLRCANCCNMYVPMCHVEQVRTYTQVCCSSFIVPIRLLTATSCTHLPAISGHVCSQFACSAHIKSALYSAACPSQQSQQYSVCATMPEQRCACASTSGLSVCMHVSPFQLAVQELLRKADVLLLFNRGCGILQHPGGRVVARGDAG